MATGTRTILLSRWRDGGRTTYDLVREFVRELPHRSASSAWQRSVRLAVSSELDVQREPRVKSSSIATPLEAKHPFFWSGYMVIDTGAEPKP
jgi:CHAT domain-containing protein